MTFSCVTYYRTVPVTGTGTVELGVDNGECFFHLTTMADHVEIFVSKEVLAHTVAVVTVKLVT